MYLRTEDSNIFCRREEPSSRLKQNHSLFNLNLSDIDLPSLDFYMFYILSTQLSKAKIIQNTDLFT